MRQTDNYTYLTQGPIHHVIGTMAVPTIISMLITSLYNIADTFFVGQIDTQSTAAVGVVFSVMFFVQAISFFFGNGSGNYISRELGAQRRRNAEVMASTALLYAIACGIVIMVVGEVLLSPLSVWLGSTPTIQPYTEQYMSIILLGSPLMTGSLCMNNQMRFQGNARFAMFGIVTGAILNVVLDPIFIFVFDMGVRGAAIATVTGQLFSFLVLFRMSRTGENIRYHWHNFSHSMTYVKEIIAGGTPSISRQGLACVATIALNVVAGHYGDAAIAAMSIVNRIAMFIFSIIVGLGQGFQPFCGFCYGARLYARVKSGYWFCVKVGTLFLVTFSILGLIFSGSIISVFRDDPDVIRIGIVALRYQLLTFPLCAFMMMSNMMMQTIRKPWRANILAAARQGLFFVPLIILLPHLFGLLGVEMCQAVSDLCALIITIPITYTGFRDMTVEKCRDSALS
jgi:putative MATE family efflux protein